jgi:hypothetical protein
MILPWNLPPLPQLTQRQKDVFKLAEFIEMAEDGWQETMVGNRFSQLVVERCLAEIEERSVGLLNEEPDIVERALWYVARRRQEWGL